MPSTPQRPEIPETPARDAELGLALQVRVMAKAVQNLGIRVEEQAHPSRRMVQRLIEMAKEITDDAARVIRVAERYKLLNDHRSEELQEARAMVSTVTAMNRQIQRVSAML